MKVSLSFPFLKLKGKRGKSVYYTPKNCNCVTMREWVYPELTVNNTNFGSRSANLGMFYQNISESYKYDLSSYSKSYNLEFMDPECYYQSYSIFMRMMYALARSNPSVDLRLITPQQVVSEGLPVITIATAIENGLLPSVADYQYLNHSIV